MVQDTLHACLGQPNTGIAGAACRDACGRAAGLAYASVVARLHQVLIPGTAIAWLLSRLAVALFLLAAAGHLASR